MSGAVSTKIPDGNENDRTSVVRDTAEGSKHRTIFGTIKDWFKKAAAAITDADEDDTPTPEKRGRKETEGGFLALARKVARRYSVLADFKGRRAVTSRYFRMDDEALEFAHRC